MNVAVVGTGFIAPVHIEALGRAQQNVVAVLGTSLDKARALAKAFDIPRAYDQYQQILADEQVQAIHITSPNRFHYEQCRQAIAANKHVICEKPLAMNDKESGELVALAARKPLVSAVCYNIRFYPLCLEMKERTAAGELGDILHVTGSYVQDWLLYDTDFNWRVLAEDGGRLRAIADIGTHWLDLVQFVTGQNVTEVCADLKTVHPMRQRPKGSVETFQGKSGQENRQIGQEYVIVPHEVYERLKRLGTERVAIATEDYGSVLLRFAGGAGGAMTVSQVSAGRKNCLCLEIAGSKGALAWNSERPNELWLGHRDRPNELLLRDPALMSPAVRPFVSYPGGHNEGFPDTFKQLFRAIYGYIERGNFSAPCPFPTFADGHREILLCEAIWKSHREARWSKVE